MNHGEYTARKGKESDYRLEGCECTDVKYAQQRDESHPLASRNNQALVRAVDRWRSPDAAGLEAVGQPALAPVGCGLRAPLDLPVVAHGLGIGEPIVSLLLCSRGITVFERGKS